MTSAIVRRSNSLIYSVRMRECSRSEWPARWAAGACVRPCVTECVFAEVTSFPRIDHDVLCGKSLRWECWKMRSLRRTVASDCYED